MADRSYFKRNRLSSLRFLVKCSLVLSLSVITSTAFADITGTVFRDFNLNGTQDLLEPGVEGLTVTAYDDDGPVLPTSTTDSNGEYSLVLPDSGKYRVEITGTPSYLNPGTAINGSTNPLVSFVENDSTHNVGLNNSREYCQANPEIIITKLLKGDKDDASVNNHNAVVKYQYTDNDTDEATGLVLPKDVGSVYGVAHFRKTNSTFVSSYFKRHSDLGPSGVGAIYRIDHDSNDAVSTFADIGGSDPRNATEGYDWEHDANGYASVGKTGIGDIELSDDESKLFAVNMDDRKLYVFDLDKNGNNTLTSSYDIPKPCAAEVDSRPMGLGFNDGMLYIGVTCTAESTVDPDNADDSYGGIRMGDRSELSAKVYSFDPQTAVFSNNAVVDIPLSYGRGCIYSTDISNAIPPEGCSNIDDDGASGNSTHPFVANWLPWQQDSDILFNEKKPGNVGQNTDYIEYPQPLLSDIEFDNDGSMILIIKDINGDRTGYEVSSPAIDDTNAKRKGNAMGDIIKACGNHQTGWTLESNGSCGGITTGGADRKEGLDGGEFYWYDNGPGGNGSRDPNQTNGHAETLMGSVLHLAGHNDIVLTTMDVHDIYDSGLMWLRNDNGEVLVDDQGLPKRLLNANIENDNDGTFLGKASALGDVEALCDPTPLEIGNYVWEDSNQNGIQEPSEQALENITVELYEGDDLVGITVTDANGEYYFGGVTNTNMIESLPLKPLTDYQIRIDLDEPDLGGKVPTLTDTNNNNDDLHDSDGDQGALNPGYSTIAYSTGNIGASNHALDFGFHDPVFSLGSLVWEDKNQDGLQGAIADEPRIAGAKVKLLVNDGSGDFVPAKDINGVNVAEIITTANGQYLFTNLPEGEYKVTVDVPSNYIASAIQNANGVANADAEDDSNIDTEITSGTTYTSGSVTLSAGSEPVEKGTFDGDNQDDNLVDANGNMTVDFGFFAPSASIDIEKATNTFDADTVAEAVQLNVGDTVTWSFVVTNNGSDTLNNISATDDKEGAITCPNTTLAAGASMTCTSITGTVVAGDYENTASVSGTGAVSGTVVNDSDPSHYTATPKVSIGNIIWNDSGSGGGVANDGVLNGSEAGIEGVVVELYKTGENPANTVATATTTTAADGTYIFDSLEEGTYFVHIPVSEFTTGKPLAIMQSSVGQGQEDASDDGVDENGDDDESDGVSSPDYVLKANSEPVGETGFTGLAVSTQDDDNTNMTVDFGFYQPASLGDRVWYDNDRDGIQDTDETGVIGVTVQLVSSTGTVIGTQQTNGSGEYNFTNLAPGDYHVEFDLSTLPTDYVVSPQDQGNDDSVDSDVDSATGNTIVTTLDAGENDPNWDMGINQPLGSWSGNVSEDTNNDDIGDKNLQGVEIKLYQDSDGDGKADGSPVATTTTDTNGNYAFTGLEPGDYVAVETQPQNLVNVSENEGGADNDKPDNGTINAIAGTVDPGEADINNDFIEEVAVVVSLGSVVWNDINDNGIQDAGEPGIKDAIVTLLDSAGNPVSGVAAQTTLADGKYYFANLAEGSYKVQVTSPVGYAPSSVQNPNANDDKENDSNIKTSVSNVHTSDLIVLTNNGEPVETGTKAGDNADDSSDDNNGNMTVDFGFTQAVKIGNLIWIEDDNDGNATSGTISYPPAGTLVTATASNGQAYTGTTDSNGKYLIEVPKNDTYIVTVATPTTYVPTAGSNDNSVPDNTSENNKTHDGTGTTVVVGITDNLTLDFGFTTAPVQTVKIGDLIWIEDDNDGNATTGTITHPPVGTIVTATGSDGSTYTGTTDENGYYEIIVPQNETYTVTIATPAGYTPTSGSDDAEITDNTTENNRSHNGNGTQVVVGTEDNLTVDFGFTPAPLEMVKIGDLIWIEDDNDGDATTGTITYPAAGTVVTATASDGTKYTGTTDSTGIYSISVPKNDTYVITVATPVGTKPSTGSGDNVVLDTFSEDNKTHDGAGTTVAIVTEDNLTIDFGFTPLSASVKIIKTVYGDDDVSKGHDNGIGCGTPRAKSQVVLIDQDKSKDMPVTYCFEVINTGESYLTNVNITDETLGVTHDHLTLLNGPEPAGLEPGASLLYYYQVLATKSLTNIATVIADTSDKDGNPTGGSVTSEGPSSAKITLIMDPPSGLKTVTASGATGMEWQMVWINDSDVAAPDVTVFDEVPEGTHFEAMEAGAFVSASGVYCEARGTSTTTASHDNNCYFEAPSATYPRGRIVWKGTISADTGKHTEDEAQNELVIRFVTVLDEPNKPNQEILNQGDSEWDFDNDGIPDTTVKTQGPEESGTSETVFVPANAIPTLSEWMLMLLALLLLVSGKRESLKLKGRKF